MRSCLFGFALENYRTAIVHAALIVVLCAMRYWIFAGFATVIASAYWVSEWRGWCVEWAVASAKRDETDDDAAPMSDADSRRVLAEAAQGDHLALAAPTTTRRKTSVAPPDQPKAPSL